MTWNILIPNLKTKIEIKMKTRSILLAIMPLLVVGCTQELTPEINQTTPEVESVVQEETQEFTVLSASLDDPQTRTYLDLQENGAKVLWAKGDQFKVFVPQSGANHQSFTFTTQDEGVSRATFTSPGTVPSGELGTCTAIYPANTTFLPSYGARYYVPTNQNAVKEGIEDELNLAYASFTSLDEDIRFNNAISIFQFRITGTAASSVKTVKLVTTSTIAGDGMLSGFENEEPTINMNRFYVPRLEDASNTIVLNGPFEPDVDYMIATVPCTTNGFSMVFLNENGDYCIKHSSKEMTLKRSRITNIGAVTVDGFEDPSLSKYSEQTIGTNPVDIMVIPDGFLESERDKFEELATQAMDYLFSVEPYASLKDYFTVYFSWKASKEQGASITDGNGNVQTQVNNAFGSRWGEGYKDMTANDDIVYEYASTHCPEIVNGDLTIDDVPILLIINDERYGGIAHSTNIGRTYCQAPFCNGGSELSWSHPRQMASSDDPADGLSSRLISNEELQELGTMTGDWRNIVLHEFGGHSIGRLADEYWSLSYLTGQSAVSEHSWPVPFGLNVSGYYATVPWQDLLDRKTSLVELDTRYDRIGRFQGAYTHIFNNWRSEKISCMIDNRPYFSTWQRALITKRIMEMAGDSFDLDAFLATNDPTDPIRDNNSTSSHIMPTDGNMGRYVEIMPLLPPPVLTEIVSTPVEP